MENINQNMEMDWNDTILEDGQELVLLDEGDYNFIVTNFERGRFPGGQKIPACNKATITVQVETEKGLSVIKFDLLFLPIRKAYSLILWELTRLYLHFSNYLRTPGRVNMNPKFQVEYFELLI